MNTFTVAAVAAVICGIGFTTFYLIRSHTADDRKAPRERERLTQSIIATCLAVIVLLLGMVWGWVDDDDAGQGTAASSDRHAEVTTACINQVRAQLTDPDSFNEDIWHREWGQFGNGGWLIRIRFEANAGAQARRFQATCRELRDGSIDVGIDPISQ